MGLSPDQTFVPSSLPRIRSPDQARSRGHAHFWHRALSRRSALGVAGGLLLAGLAHHAQTQPALARQTDRAMPKPIAGGGFEVDGELLHVYDYLPGNEPATIGDFRGLVAINHLQGEGTVTRGGGGGGISTPTTTGDRLVYDADMRIMKGRYVGEDGQEHQGTFGFI